jgi:hypothetical protein
MVTTMTVFTTKKVFTAIKGYMLTLFVIMCIGSGAAATGAHGQTSPPHGVDESAAASQWTQHFGDQVAQLLKTGDPDRQAEAMALILHYSRSQHTIDFGPAISPLLRVYDHAGSEDLKIMALVALNAIGGDAVVQGLIARVERVSSERLRKHTLHVLTAHGRTR